LDIRLRFSFSVNDIRILKGENAMSLGTNKPLMCGVLVLLLVLSLGGGALAKDKVFRMYYTFTNPDPAFVDVTNYISMMGLFEGLVRFDENFNAVPGVAERWEVSEDGLIYTFYLRQDAKWSNGDAVTAYDFEYSWKRTMNPATFGGTPPTFIPSPLNYLKNGMDFMTGKITDPDVVGIKALDDYILQATLEQPTPQFIQTCMLYRSFPVHKGIVEKYGKDWARFENWVGNGPFKIESWLLNSQVVLVPNEHWYGWKTKAPGMDKIIIYQGTENVTAYENNEIDFVYVQPGDIKRIQKDPKLSKDIRSADITSFIYVCKIPSDNPFLDDPRVLQAFAMAIDREKYVKAIYGDTARSTTVSIQRGVPGHQPDVGYKFDLEKARALLVEAGYPGGKGAPTIRILAVTTVGAAVENPDFAAIKSEWETNLGVKVEIDLVESGVYVQKRTAPQDANYVGFYYGSFANTYAHPSCLIGQVFSVERVRKESLTGAEYREYFDLNAKLGELSREGKSDPQLAAKIETYLADHAAPWADAYVEKLQEAADAKSVDEQIAAYQGAEKIYLESGVYIPIYARNPLILVRSNIKGLVFNPFLNALPVYFDWISVE
jgi:oligopeptide transport system substrate-binding protein